IVNRIKNEVKTDPKVVATGGLAHLIAQETDTIDAVDDYLTLRGLKIIFDRNKK
ncbi:MAG: pantothenate kinase, partial [Deltaproteobacteria bacterium]